MKNYRHVAVLTAILLYLILCRHMFYIPRSIPTVLFLLTPICIIALIGAYAAVSIIYGVFKFNRSERALTELKEDLNRAATSLQRAGFDFEKFKIPRL
ncbi:Dolichol-phosphate mannosyltransferase subunit 3 (DPM3) family protein [Babesia bovis T2Bo]|uniref:Dolichol-phosphate mannosyltransferase subunit 3 (DPM3) family protein n=1 Tax=Babesia bovis T2Bo TaxID=484906 RepID=UPI001C345DF3|nr:Dolichol-phosphate mannosyltransferase subunit 3 (DPM3) family protein [Babesia bovis T2Bo]KAG6440123.1 Dolichol-phosphate mannosyltransferase subunit 3 (DPM3) family protein [Babesia bovis T2Bo]